MDQRRHGGDRLVRGYEPRYDFDYAYGHQGELLFGEYLEMVAAGDGRAEVKRKSYLDLWFYVETHHDPGRRGIYVPSGISTTGAHIWAYVLDDTGIAAIIPTELLREALTDHTSKPKAEEDGSCPTRGQLIRLDTLVARQAEKRRR